MHKTGLVSISFRSLTVEQIVAAAKAAGLNWIEWGSDVHAPYTDIAQLEKIAALQKAAGVGCCSYGTYFRIGVTPAQELPGYIRAAKILGTDILRLWCGDKGSEVYTPAEREALYEECRKLAAIAEKENVTLCMECHNNTMTDRVDAAFDLMQAVNSPAFRMYYQPNQFRSVEENIIYAQRMAPYTDHIHVFNWESINRYPLSEATEIWRKYLDCFSGDHFLLLEFMPDNMVESLPTEAKALFEIIGG